MPQAIKAQWRQRYGTWYVRFSHPKTGRRIERSTGCRVKRLAEGWLEAEWERLLRPEDAPPPDLPLAEAVAEYIAERERAIEDAEPGAESAVTLSVRKKKLRTIVRRLGPDGMLSELDRERVEEFKRERLGEVSAHSVYKDLCELRLLGRWCAERGYLLENPAEGVSVAFKLTKEDRSITPEEFVRLVAAMPEKRRTYARLAVETGTRPGKEIEAVTWGDVDAERCLVRIRGTKTGEADRSLPVRAEFIQYLAEARGDAADGDRVAGDRWRNAPRDFRAASKKAGLRHVRPYDLRHTYASWALQGGAPDAHVAKALGHSSTTMVHKVYGHLRPEHLRTVTDALPPIPPAPGPDSASEGAAEPSAAGASGENAAPNTPQNECESGANASKFPKNEETREVAQPRGFLENSGGDDQIRTGEWRFCRPLPYHLATSPST